ncbi:MAG TPA: protein kinase [Polyangiaceae bacterium]|jgi:serine/threonine-protein kinase
MECPSCHTQLDGSQRFCPACGTGLSASSLDGAPEGSIIGQTLGGKYRVVRLIGEGGMGAVYEGEQKLGTTKRKVAVKTLHPHLSRDAKIKARFEREVGTVAELEHPNTIQVFDFGANEEGILYIVMEFLQGRSLAKILESEGPMAPDRVNRIIQQVCGSLEEAHSRGIVHRDLKPDNVVLVDRAGQKDFVKVLDFGIAKRSQETDNEEQKLTQQGMVLGTPPYMSPEQFTGRPIDSRSDIYSLGVMAYEMLSGRLPFHANTAWEWATQHMTQAPYPIEQLAEGARAPEPMRNAIKQALAKSPDDRFHSAREFADGFSGAMDRVASAATAAQPMAPRQKTEVAAPYNPAAFGGVGPVSAMGTPGQSPTPSGNVSFPTPAAIPQAPVREEHSKGARTGLLVAAAVIAVASVGAIALAMRGSGARKDVVFDPGAPAAVPATTLTGATPDNGSSPTPTGSSGAGGADVPPLSGAGAAAGVHPAAAHFAAQQHSGGQPAVPAVGTPAPTATVAPLPTASPQVPPAMTAFPFPTAAQIPPPLTRGRYDGPECVNARRLRAIGHPREAESLALACIAKGGTP